MRFSIRGSATDRPGPRPPRGSEPDVIRGADRGRDPFGTQDPAVQTAHEPLDGELGAQAGVTILPEGGEVVSRGSPWMLVARTFAQNRLAVIGIGTVVVIVLFSFVGPLIYHTDQLNPNLIAVNQGPSGAHPLGTDSSGFDILGRLMEGGQSSIEVGLAVGFIATLFGLVYGAISGFFGKVLDTIMMRIVDVGLAIPIVFLFIFMAQVFRPSLTLLIVLLAVVSWQIPSRLVRGETLSLRTREYVQAVQVMGGRSARIILRHIIPNTIGTIMVTVTFQVANAILVLAVLQYLGFGLPPSVPTWGSMLSDGTTDLASGYWWQVYPALAMIVITVVAFNFIGDALQDAFDVRLQER
jgi:peptide/nickel transport system permease protein